MEKNALVIKTLSGFRTSFILSEITETLQKAGVIQHIKVELQRQLAGIITGGHR